MSLRSTPDPDALNGALARRIDLIENDLQRIGTDVTALGRGVADLTAQIRRLTDSRDVAGQISDEADEEALPAQPDWINVPDVETARLWLDELDEWLRETAEHHGLSIGAACWPFHPDVVALLLALQAERSTAYDGQRPTPVTEWLTRWLPAVSIRIDEALVLCVSERGHRHDGHTYDVRGIDLASIATWWATDRDIPAPTAFALRPLT